MSEQRTQRTVVVGVDGSEEAPLLDWTAVERNERARLATQLATWSGTHPDVEVRREVSRDRPAHRLLQLCEQAQLVVVGSRGRGSSAACSSDR
jgi:nucleotide-binding universal stress UspA family protein